MKILEVNRRRRSLYALTLENAEPVQVDVRTFDESPYAVGCDITCQQLEGLLEQSQYNRAHDRALYLLGLRDYACRELEKKLHTEATPEIAAQVVERLRQVGLLDDERYAARAARSLSEYKRMPRRRVEQELRRRGVEPETARTAAEELECEDFQQALALIEKRYYNKIKDPDARQQVVAALARRGFTYTAIRRAMELVALAPDSENEETEDTWL